MPKGKRGFVFGKYYPFHLGHKALIDFALTHCNQLSILVCCSNKETINSATRVSWIEEIYQDNPRVKVIPLDYDEDDLPNTSVSSVTVSQLWAEKFKSIVPDAEMVITSEDYGDFVAGFMNIQHIAFDKERYQVQISATAIREAIYDKWDFLPAPVKAYFQKKVVLLGTESTGKSSLSLALAKQFDSTLVEEVGRELIPQSSSFTQEDLYKVARAHAENINTACAELKPFVFIDTDIHITQSYARFGFGQYLELGENIYEANRAHLYFYLTSDLAFFQDGTRLDESGRNELDGAHRKTLQDFDVEFVEVGGAWNERLHKMSLILKDGHTWL